MTCVRCRHFYENQDRSCECRATSLSIGRSAYNKSSSLLSEHSLFPSTIN